ncbi:MAG: ABC transporter ATP-binding protein [Candidatus Methanomethylophilaceae archaeon]
MIELNNISKAYYTKRNRSKARIVLDNVSMRIEDNEFVCLIGPSGCGKTTVLNLIAGFERPTMGTVTCCGQVVERPSPRRGVVFQEYSLFPWLSAKGNIMLALECKGVPESERERIAMDALDKVSMAEYADMRPNTFSGGMKQRVAIARMLALDPDIMLMDEPFSALDEATRNRLDRDIVRLWSEERKTIVFVTHIIEEALAVATRIVLFSDSPGRIVKEWNLEPGPGRDLHSQRYIDLKNEISRALAENSRTGDF